MEKLGKKLLWALLFAWLLGWSSQGALQVQAEDSTIYLDAAAGDDTKDGLTQETAVKTFAKAVSLMPENGTIQVKSFDKAAGIVFDKPGTLVIAEDLAMQGSGVGITLKKGTHLKVAEGKTLTMSGYGKAVVVEKDAQINDGTYKFTFPANGFAFVIIGGQIKGSAPGKVNMDITNGYFQSNSADSVFENLTLNQRYEGDKWQLYEWNGFRAVNSTLNLYHLPVYFKGPVTLDGSTLSIDGAGVNYQTGLNLDNAWTVGQYHITNHSLLEVKNFSSHWRGKGITLGYGIKMLVDNGSTVRVTNNKNGGLNVNEGQVTFDGATLEGANHSGSHFGVQNKAGNKITFLGNSRVETPAQTSVDNGLSDSKQGYVVLGGSHLVKYDDKYQSGKAIPVNGEEHGNERLSLFTLSDSSVSQLNVLDQNGAAYSYLVAELSSDQKKHVWVPAAKVTFQVNEVSAVFPDGSAADKEVLGMRGMKLSDAKEANGAEVVIPGEPTAASGKIFAGWFYKDGEEEKQYDPQAVLTKDLVVYAKWTGEAVNKLVAYDINNGSGAKPTIIAGEVKEDTIQIVSLAEVQKVNPAFETAGKNFTYWSTDKEGKEKVEAGDFVPLKGKDAVTVYANWEPKKYTVRFSANGGKFSADSPFKAEATKDKFTIETDATGGEVAVAKEKAEHGTTLRKFASAIQVNGINEPNKTMAARDYHSIHYVDGWFGDSYYWYSDPDQNKTVSASAAITGDMTYYIKWKPDAGVEEIREEVGIQGDIWGRSGETSSQKEFHVAGETISFTGAVKTAEIKEKMKGIEALYPTDKTIDLSELRSSFTATLTVPEGIRMPETAEAKAAGMNGVFEVTGTKIQDRTIVVEFALKAEKIKTYADLKQAISGTDEYLTLTIDGFELAPEIEDRKMLTVTGTVTGTFHSIAAVTLEDATKSVKLFDFGFEATQEPSGKDEVAQDDSTIQFTVEGRVPQEEMLLGDILIGDDTEHDKLHEVKKGEEVDYTGRLNITDIQDKINLLAAAYGGDPESIRVEGVDSSFTAVFTLPDTLELQKDSKVTFTENDLFEVKPENIIRKDHTVTVKMTLKKQYSKFADLQRDVNSISEYLNLTVSKVKVRETVKAEEKLTVIGQVDGSFRSEAVSAGGKREFYYYHWTAKQDPAGRDADQAEGDRDTIRYTVVVKKEEAPVDPSGPNTPEKPQDPKKPASSDKTREAGKRGKKAPKTADAGDGRGYMAVMLLAGGILVMGRKRSHQTR